MTERLYYSDAYLQRFEARIVDRADEGRRVYLNRSAFYPTSGGQPNDLGRLGGVAVVDVIDEEERVAHLLASPLAPHTSELVAGDVDWTRRFDHMQQHTGQHLLSAIFADALGWATLSVHFGPDYATLDLDAESISIERLREVEERANVLVAEDRSVTVSFEDAASAQGLRKASDRNGSLRIVTIDGIDRSACGGTHVHHTGAIGAVLLRRQEKIRKATRVEFVCGLRAMRRA
ncbi:MAG: alanyl-tRNA editing protein, partial [Gemmatimonadaceae bacterium]